MLFNLKWHCHTFVSKLQRDNETVTTFSRHQSNSCFSHICKTCNSTTYAILWTKLASERFRMQWASVVSWEAFHNCVSKNCLETNHRNFYKDPDVISFSIIILVYTTFMQVLVFTWKYSQLLREKYSRRLRLSQKYPASFGFCAIEIPNFLQEEHMPE